jgi:CheY-like chemotaxis protein/anti-sigma regulatory factor (Ser/Thr protein kinase)
MIEKKEEIIKDLDLKILVVEDDKMTSMIIKKTLKELFENIDVAYDGEEGLEKYHQNKPDIIICDNQMPKMNGIDMITKIREKDDNTSIVFMTAYVDVEEMIKYINLRVSQFVPKPVKKEVLLNAVDTAIEKVVSKRKELEALKIKDEKRKKDEERSFKKELKVIQDDYYSKYIQGKEDWSINIFYKPLEVLSGDSYSVRKIDENRVLFIIVDAMGKGLPASLSSVLSISFINYAVNRAVRNNNFVLEALLLDYIEFIKTEILDDEIVSLSMVVLDHFNKTIQYSTYSMPSIIVKKTDGSIVELQANNFAISQYSSFAQVDIHDLGDDVEAIIFNSDGLDENELEDGTMYLDQMYKDIQDTHNFSTFTGLFDSKIEEYSDDSTMFYIAKEPKYTDKENYTIKTKLEDVQNSTTLVEAFMQKHEMPISVAASVAYAYNEIILNAYEHGNLHINYDEKQLFLEQMRLEEECEKREKIYKDKKIYLELFHRQVDDKTHEVMIQVKDEGDGFDTHVFKRNLFEEGSFHGRGVSISKSILDDVHYDSTGNTVRIKKSFNTEEEV